MKKILTMLLSAVIIATIAIGGTLAFMTQKTEALVNTFTVGKIQMKLEEPQYDAAYGAGNPKIIPGTSINKDPTVTVENGSEPCYVYVNIKDGLNETVSGCAAWAVGANWEQVKNTSGSEVAGLYCYREPVDAGSGDQVLSVLKADDNGDTVLFNGDQITMENIESLDGKTIVVQAFAYQQAKVTQADADEAAIRFFNPSDA